MTINKPNLNPPPPLPYWVAHTPSKANPRFHSLKRHILDVSGMARDFAIPLGAGEIAYFLGILHDLGKFSDDFQTYLLNCYLATKPGATCKAPLPGSAPHKQAGARAAERRGTTPSRRCLSTKARAGLSTPTVKTADRRRLSGSWR